MSDWMWWAIFLGLGIGIPLLLFVALWIVIFVADHAMTVARHLKKSNTGETPVLLKERETDHG